MIPIGFVRGLLIDVEKGVVKEVDIDFSMKKLEKMLRRKDLICSEKYIQGVLYMVVCGYHCVKKPISARWEDGKVFCRGNLYVTKATCGTKGGLDDKDFEMLGNRISMVRITDDNVLNREYSTYALYGLSETPNPTVWSD